MHIYIYSIRSWWRSDEGCEGEHAGHVTTIHTGKVKGPLSARGATLSEKIYVLIVIRWPQITLFFCRDNKQLSFSHWWVDLHKFAPALSLSLLYPICDLTTYLVTNYNLTSPEESDNHVPRVSCDTTLLSDSLLMSSIDRLKINCHVSTTVTCPKSLVHVRIYYATPIHTCVKL